MEKKLDLILQKLEKLDALENGQKEIYQIVNALRENQEVTNAKLEVLTMEVHKLHGEVENVKDHLQFNTYKIAETELEIFRLKKQ